MTSLSVPAVSRSSPTWIWVQLAIGWLPLWALSTVLMATVHGGSVAAAVPGASRLVFGAALLGLLVYRFVASNPWPHPIHPLFVVKHCGAMTLYAFGCMLFYSATESLLRWQFVLVVGPGLAPFFVTGAWFYVMVAAVAYANEAATRSSQLAALEAKAQLAVLRGQMHPHFLFNALHTVVQLIPVDPRSASRAAELLADVLRTALSEPRDKVTLAEEWDFVQRYLAIERIRFGARLQVTEAFDPPSLACRLPSFALQTLVENAVRHAAAPRIEAVTIRIAARVEGDVLVVLVSDDGPGADVASIAQSAGTGLRRLREQLRWLHGSKAGLTLAGARGAGLEATLRIPQRTADDDD